MRAHECPHCRRIFEPTRPEQLYCSRTCARTHGDGITMIIKTLVVANGGVMEQPGDKRIDELELRDTNSRWVKVLVPERQEALVRMALALTLKFDRDAQ